MSSLFTACVLWGLLLASGLTAGVNNPVIVESPTDQVAVTGSDVLLRCRVENLPVGDDLVQWTKDGFALGHDRDIPGFKQSMVGDVSIGEYNLLIKGATIEDEAEYECQVRVNRLRAKATVTILVPPDGPVIENMTKDDRVNVKANSENVLTCKSLNGKPAGRLAWFKDGREIQDSVVYVDDPTPGRKLINSSSSLRIFPSDGGDAQRYECRMTIDKRFEGMEEIDSLISTHTVELNVQRPPVAVLSIVTAEVTEGGNLLARCKSYSSKPPASSFEWYINGVVVEGSTDESFEIYGVNKSMNNAIIGCISINSVGESEMSTGTIGVLYPPILRVAPRDIVTNFTAQVEMMCEWESNPPSRITWYKEGVKNEIVGEGNKLEIFVEDQSAAGVYVCVGDALGVASRSTSARLNVLGPPIINSDVVQRASTGMNFLINCTLGSTPGISHVIWSWVRKGNLMTLKDNESIKLGNAVKYTGIMRKGGSSASLRINEVEGEDFTNFNCTAHNDFGDGTVTIKFEEQFVAATGMMMPVIGAAIGGVILLLAIILIVFCILKKRQEKSTTFPPEKEIFRVEDADSPPQVDNRSDVLASKKLVNPDTDSDNPSSPASVASQEDVVRDQLTEFPNSAHNDDGYHTEEANSWNRNEKQSPSSSPARSVREGYPPRGNYMTSMAGASSSRGLERPASPYDASDGVSETGFLRYNMTPQPYPQYPLQYASPLTARTTPPEIMYDAPSQQQLPPNYYPAAPSSSSGYRTGVQGYPAIRSGSNAPSIISSHRSVTPSPYVLGRATPNSVFMDRGIYQVPFPNQQQLQPSSSQSSLDQITSSVGILDPYETPTQMTRLNSMVSQTSRSSEMLNKPLTARMATHV